MNKKNSDAIKGIILIAFLIVLIAWAFAPAKPIFEKGDVLQHIDREQIVYVHAFRDNGMYLITLRWENDNGIFFDTSQWDKEEIESGFVHATEEIILPTDEIDIIKMYSALRWLDKYEKSGYALKLLQSNLLHQ